MLVYSINSGEYEPISVGDSYLYLLYDKIHSFLIRNYEDNYVKILAKPVFSNGVVQWYADHHQELSRIADLPQDVQIRIKQQYWQIKQRLDADIDDLEFSSNPEKKKWGGILRQVFNDENNMILSDGDFWCLLWGWKFRNKAENYLAPEFLKEPRTTEPLEEGSSSAAMNDDISGTKVTEPEKETEAPLMEDAIPVNPPSGHAPQRAKSNHFLYRIKRFFRNFTYRYWGLMLIILFIMFLFCLFQKCNNKPCEPATRIEKKLEDLERKVKERCQ
jgi:hypothetical protein